MHNIWFFRVSGLEKSLSWPSLLLSFISFEDSFESLPHLSFGPWIMLTTPKPRLWGDLALPMVGSRRDSLPFGLMPIPPKKLKKKKKTLSKLSLLSFSGHDQLGMLRPAEISSEPFVPSLPPKRELEQSSSALHVSLNQGNSCPQAWVSSLTLQIAMYVSDCLLLVTTLLFFFLLKTGGDGQTFLPSSFGLGGLIP